MSLATYTRQTEMFVREGEREKVMYCGSVCVCLPLRALGYLFDGLGERYCMCGF